MIAQARITSDTTATVHLADETVEVTGANLPEIRNRVKQVFITAARSGGEAVDVVIVEPDVRHHLRVEPTGRIAGRTADDRPLYGPAIDDPLIAPPSGGHAAESLPTDDTADLSSITPDSLGPAGPTRPAGPAETSSATGEHAAIGSPATGEHAAIGSPVTGEHPAVGSPATGELPTVRPHRARRRRAAAMPPSALSGASVASHGSAGSDSAPSASATSASSSAGSAASAPSASSSAGSAASAPSAPAAGSDTGSHAPVPASASRDEVITSVPSGGVRSGQEDRPGRDERSEQGGRSAASGSSASKRPLPPRTVSDSDGRPTLKDLQSSTARPEKAKATRGFRGFITKLTGGAISPAPGKAERLDNERLERIRRQLDGPRNIAVVNLKGGAHKTTASLMIAATLGVTRGGNVLAWDNNETRGTLGWRGLPTEHHRTAVDLLHDIDRLRSPEASNADLDPYVRPQGEMRFDILASDEDPGSAALIDDEAFGELNDTLSRFYRIKVIDTGNNVRASNWLAAVRNADQLVIISTVREDTFNAAAWMIDELRATGLADQVDHAVTILSHSAKGKVDSTLRQRLLAHFGAHTRAVTEVPYEQQFVSGSHLDWSRIHPKTKEAWLDATALIIDGL
ncbi:MinD/ParA family protein [Brachybacterium sp. GCM10030252]|uniref:MinD/ParA family ATP-binding protein n=1 Tax=Brachybacterium sp. GCM10030252 TaxID=3273380 RepID=UPI00360C590E